MGKKEGKKKKKKKSKSEPDCKAQKIIYVDLSDSDDAAGEDETQMQAVGSNGGNWKESKEIELQKEAAQQGNAEAQHYLGIAYLLGEGVEKN